MAPSSKGCPPIPGCFGSLSAAGLRRASLATVLVRVRAIGVIPEDRATGIRGSVRTSAQAAPELDVSYFLTDHLALELIAVSTCVLPPTLTVQYHPWPRARFSPYLGAGVTVAWFYDAEPAAPTITKLGLQTTAGLPSRSAPTTT